jgi:hypothetical protein
MRLAGDQVDSGLFTLEQYNKQAEDEEDEGPGQFGEKIPCPHMDQRCPHH